MCMNDFNRSKCVYMCMILCACLIKVRIRFNQQSNYAGGPDLEWLVICEFGQRNKTKQKCEEDNNCVLDLL